MADALKTPPRRSRDNTRSRSFTSPTLPNSPQLSPVPSRTSGATGLARSQVGGGVLGSPFQPLKSQITPVPRRLLVPTSLTKSSGGISEGVSSPPSKHKPSITRLTRPRSNSAPTEALSPQTSEELRWIDIDCRFEIVEEDIQLSGYQIYAVEKWIVERNRKVTLLTVYTGDPKDKINVTAVAPLESLSPSEADKEWERAMYELRREGARPRETDMGVIIVTSLANFRSDYTVVQIPDGDFMAYKAQLYVNINLLRMGCSGRSALTLQEASDTTKDRFLGMYSFREDVRQSQRFIVSVLELVKLIQCGLSLFGMFPIDIEQQNGLLCDVAVEGLKNWVAEIGEPYMKIEPMERIADPTTISALFSTVLCVRNKLNSLGLSHVPKDPFLHARQFTRALAHFVNQRLVQTPSSGSPPAIKSPPSGNAVGLGITSPATVPLVHRAYLNYALIQRIDAAFEKYRASEGYKVHRVLFTKLEDITVATSQAIATASSNRNRSASLSMTAHNASVTQSPASPPPASSMSATGMGREKDAELLDGTTDLSGLISKAVSARGKDSHLAPSIRFLWTGRFDKLEAKRKEGVLSDAEKERDEERERERSDSEDGEGGEIQGNASSDMPWSNRMQKKIGNWAGREFGRSRTKKGSIDLSAIKDKLTHLGGRSTPTTSLPSVVVSRYADPEEQLSGMSSGQVSPNSPNGSMVALGAVSSGRNSVLAINDTEFNRRLSQFNQKHPRSRPNFLVNSRGMNIASWSDPVSAEETANPLRLQRRNESGEQTAMAGGFAISPPHLGGLSSMSNGMEGIGGASMSRDTSLEPETGERGRARPPKGHELKRSYSFDDSAFMQSSDCISISRMQIDVDLCAQCMISRRRTKRVAAVIAALQALVKSSSGTNDELRKYHSDQASILQELQEKCQIVADIEEAVGTADSAGLDTDALLYEERSFNVPALWRMAQAPRQRVFAIRERVFGARRGKKYPVESHGRFNRAQKLLDGTERLVDWMGRTESEVEEERELPEIMPAGDESEDEVEMVLEDGGGTEKEKRPEIVSSPSMHDVSGGGYVRTTSAWLLELFSRWGRVLGVGGADPSRAPAKESLPESSSIRGVQETNDSDRISTNGKELQGIPEESESDWAEASDSATATPSNSRIINA